MDTQATVGCVTTDVPAFERILAYLRHTRGFDFTAYKRTTLMRRVRRRMQTVEIDDFDAYRAYLASRPAEFAALFNTILINVTSFFRDPDVWDQIAREVVPTILAARPTGPIRVWSAGCASGQEAYTLAIVLAEALGLDAFRSRVKIYATDVDDEALADARRATFTDRQMADIPPDLADRHFDRNGTDGYICRRDLRRAIIFGRHDLVQDAPISRVDLLVCRNTLMYFTADAQSRIMPRFYFSVAPTGFLVLGRAEMLFRYAPMFSSVHLKHRIFKPVARHDARSHLQMLCRAGWEGLVPHHPIDARLRDAAFDTAPIAQIVVDATNRIVAINAAARDAFGLTVAETGARLQDLELSYRPADLRSALDQVHKEMADVRLAGVAWDTPSGRRFLDVELAPLRDEQQDGLLGVHVCFVDVTPVKEMQDEIVSSKHALETAYEELQSTSEELETTNEELQSTVEELETTNEELQSTNEELETMNEELQSTNEELQTMNDELRNRGVELNSMNEFLEAVFASLGAAVVVLDREYRVQVWNSRATELWGVRQDEAQHAYFFGLDIGLPVGELHQPIRDVTVGSASNRTLMVPATNRRGRAIDCRVQVLPLRSEAGAVSGVILLMDEPSAGADAVS